VLESKRVQPEDCFNLGAGTVKVTQLLSRCSATLLLDLRLQPGDLALQVGDDVFHLLVKIGGLIGVRGSLLAW
jgi:hypothetical protein